MAEEIDDPILKKLNGSKPKKKVEEQTTSEEEDPILRQLNQVKKKEPTTEDQKSSDGFTAQKPVVSTGVSSVVQEPSPKPSEKNTGGELHTGYNPLNPTGIGDALVRSFVNFFTTATPLVIHREALKSMPTNYEELLKKADQGPTDAEETGILTMEKIKSTPLKDLLAEYKERAAQEPGTQLHPNQNRAAKDTYNILLRASKSSNTSPERVMGFYKDEVNRLIQKTRDTFEKEKIVANQTQGQENLKGIPQDFTSIKSAKDFEKWLEGSVGQGVASSIGFATSPVILFKMERYDALDEIRAKKAQNLSEKFGTEITPISLEKIQTKEENQSDENIANTVGLISMGLEGLGFLAGAGKAIKQVFLKSAKKQVLEQVVKFGVKGALKDIGIAGGGEFATEYLQDVDQQVGALLANGMTLTEAMANVNHQRAFNAGMQGFAPGAVFGSVTAISEFNENNLSVPAGDLGKNATTVIKEEQKNVDPNDINALDKSAEAIQQSVDNSEQIKSEEGIQNALQKPSTEGLLQREQGEAGVPGSKRGRVEPGVEGKETAQANLEGEKETAKEPVVKEGVKKVFVYGTLKDAETRKQALGEDVTTTSAETTGKVKDVGDGYTTLESGEDKVPGQVMELSPQQLEKLDKYENKYQREEITLANGEKAFAYKLKEKQPVPYTPEPSLSPEQKAVETKFGKYLNENFGEAKKTYKEKFGNVLNADNARELSKDYEDNRALSSAVHEPAAAFIRKLYQEKLDAEWFLKGEENTGIFTSGGTGSGKTVSLEGEDPNSVRFIYDGNLDHFETAKEKIDKALNAGVKDIDIRYTYRDPVEAFENGVIKRMLDKKSDGFGRTVPIFIHAQTHIGSRVNIDQLMRQYKGNSKVHFTVIDNSRGAGNAKEVRIAKIPEIPYTAKELEKKLTGITEKLYNEGKITKSQYEGLTIKRRDYAEGVRPASTGETKTVSTSNVSNQAVNESTQQTNAGKPQQGGSEGLTQEISENQILSPEARETTVSVSVPSLKYIHEEINAGSAHDTLMGVRKKISKLVACLKT
jgi:gamma-glutamylcyclotransferase (GGCT)/AIG2-like uncharacterized protein YtfP